MRARDIASYLFLAVAWGLSFLVLVKVVAALDAAGVKTFRADWTRRDAAITAELQKLGRSGVPVYVLQAPGKPPIVLSEVLSVADVKAALAQL